MRLYVCVSRTNRRVARVKRVGARAGTRFKRRMNLCTVHAHKKQRSVCAESRKRERERERKQLQARCWCKSRQCLGCCTGCTARAYNTQHQTHQTCSMIKSSRYKGWKAFNRLKEQRWWVEGQRERHKEEKWASVCYSESYKKITHFSSFTTHRHTVKRAFALVQQELAILWNVHSEANNVILQLPTDATLITHVTSFFYAKIINHMVIFTKLGYL